MNWLLIKGKYNHCVNPIAFKCFDNQCLHYLSEVFIKALECSLSLRTSYKKIKQPSRKTSAGQNGLSFSGSAS